MRKEGKLDSPLQAAAETSNPADKLASVLNSWRVESLFQTRLKSLTTVRENYHIWRAAFKNMTKDVNIMALLAETRLALMIEYTTGDPKRLVERLRNAFIENPVE